LISAGGVLATMDGTGAGRPAPSNDGEMTMRCPNCEVEFTLTWDYAEHLRSCRPALLDAAATARLLARLNAAAARLEAEVDEHERRVGTSAEPERVLACA
jgi:uncharacterized C2H2 Zn-finger protein